MKQKIGVLGAGMMGAEISYCFALAGFDVLMKDIEMERALKGLERIEKVVDKAISKGKISSDRRNEVLQRIKPTDNHDGFETADIIIEVISENLELKKTVLQEIDRIAKDQCVILSNTSSLSITLLASFLDQKRKEKFVGSHFFSPASIMKLVEVIPGLDTSDETTSTVMQLISEIGKTPIRVKDVTGFVVNRILHAMWIETNRLLEEEVATVEDIDIGCKLGLGHPIGPYELMDLTSNDLNLSVQQILWDAYGERFRPRPILKQKVDAKHLGRKTGKGWYTYKPK
jgi:3-hydroxybutyryl-CoA dehydrogenase